MQIDYIRRNTPESFSEEGGAYIQIVNKDTVGLTDSIEEARTTLHVVGSASMIEGYFVGVLKSVFEGIQADGHPRSVGDVTFYPVCGGQFDLDKGWDPLVNDVRIKARLLNGLTLDVSDWTFRDVTEGRVAFSIETVSNGSVEGIVTTDDATLLNCKSLPAKENLTVSWVCGTKSGTVASDKFTSNVARITVDKSAYAALTSADDGKEIIWTVKGCYNKATKKAIVKYTAPVENSVKPTSFGQGEDLIWGESWGVTGTGLFDLSGKPEANASYIAEKSVLFTPTGESEVEITTMGGTSMTGGTYYEFSSSLGPTELKTKTGTAKVKFVCKTKETDGTWRTDTIYTNVANVVTE